MTQPSGQPCGGQFSDPRPATELQNAARVIADNNWLSHDWEDFMDAARALDQAGLLRLDGEAGR